MVISTRERERWRERKMERERDGEREREVERERNGMRVRLLPFNAFADVMMEGRTREGRR